VGKPTLKDKGQLNLPAPRGAAQIEVIFPRYARSNNQTARAKKREFLYGTVNYRQMGFDSEHTPSKEKL